jgi:hypothetical protein
LGATELIVRFLIGGAVVSAFTIIGDISQPKSFAGLFGAAPSVALATPGLTILTSGKEFAVHEDRTTIAGAIALVHLRVGRKPDDDALKPQRCGLPWP